MSHDFRNFRLRSNNRQPECTHSYPVWAPCYYEESWHWRQTFSVRRRLKYYCCCHPMPCCSQIHSPLALHFLSHFHHTVCVHEFSTAPDAKSLHGHTVLLPTRSPDHETAGTILHDGEFRLVCVWHDERQRRRQRCCCRKTSDDEKKKKLG